MIGVIRSEKCDKEWWLVTFCLWRCFYVFDAFPIFVDQLHTDIIQQSISATVDFNEGAVLMNAYYWELLRCRCSLHTFPWGQIFEMWNFLISEWGWEERRGVEGKRRKTEWRELKRKGREKEAREMMYRESLNLFIYDSKRNLHKKIIFLPLTTDWYPRFSCLGAVKKGIECTLKMHFSAMK